MSSRRSTSSFAKGNIGGPNYTGRQSFGSAPKSVRSSIPKSGRTGMVEADQKLKKGNKTSIDGSKMQKTGNILFRKAAVRINAALVLLQEGNREDSQCTLSQESVAEFDDDYGDTKLEEQLTNERLQQLEKIFQDANTNNDRGLDNDEFRNAMRQTMGQHLTDQELDAMFMKVDINVDHTVDWDEYLSYMLLEYRERDNMKMMIQRKPMPENIKLVPNMGQFQRRHDTIVRMRHQPNILKHSNNLYKLSPDISGGKYISVSKGGVINFWSMDLNHLRKHKLPPPKSSSKNIKLWVTDLVCVPNLNMIAVSSTSGTIVFYDLTAYSFHKVLTLADLEICVTCMDYWVDPISPSKAKFIWGDARGNVAGLVFDNCPSVCFLQPTINKNFKARVEFSELMKQNTCGVRAYFLPKIHEDLVIEIKYFHSLHECFLSCCRGNSTSLFLGDIRQKKASYFKVRKGVQSFDYSRTHNVIITGGRDSLIRVWNPFVPVKPVMVIQGTKSSILYVFVHEEGEYIFSISQDKEIHIFDMNTQICIQHIHRKNVSIGSRPITSAVFHTGKQALILGNNKLAMFEHHEKDIYSQQMMSHENGISHVLYNDLFHQVVSGGVDSLVVVWNAEDGDRIIQFVAHRIPLIGGSDIQVEITAMRFDPTQRRLITSARDGLVKIWNHNNGAMLRTIQVLDTNEIVGIICPNQRIMTAGWNRRITVYVDLYDDDSFHNWQCCHNEDITALCFKPPNIVATASHDGDILIWMIETGHVTLRFNAHIGIDPISQVYKIKEPVVPLIQVSSTQALPCPDTESDEAEDDDDMIDESEELQMLQEFMSYNTHRASIAADVPWMNRRQSESKPRNRHMTGFVTPTLETIQSTVTLASFDENAEFDQSLLNISNNSSHKKFKKIKENIATVRKKFSYLRNIKNENNCNNNNGNYKKIDEDRYKYDLYVQKNEASILKLIFLHKRESVKNTATLVSASTGGWIRFWVVEHSGGLIGQFNAAHHPGESVQSICVDRDNEYLFTGDTEGYIKVWDISEYCIDYVATSHFGMDHKQAKYEQFPLFSHSGTLNETLSRQSKFRPPPLSTNPDKTWVCPELMNSFKGHVQGITGIAYINDSHRLITSSSDCSVRLWDIYGQFIGIFGQETPWSSLLTLDHALPLKSKRKARIDIHGRRGFDHQTELETKIVMKCRIPKDIRTCASATTLRIFNGGITRRWKLLRNVVLLSIYLMNKALAKRSLQKHRPSQVMATETKFEQEEKYVHRVTPDLDLISVTKELKKLTTQGITSNILGKTYKAQMKHKPAPQLPKLRIFQTQCDAYASLPFYELTKVSTELKPPPTIVDIQERQPNILNLHTRFGKPMRKLRTIQALAGGLSRRESNRDESSRRRMSRYNRSSSVNMAQGGTKMDEYGGRGSIFIASQNVPKTRDLTKLPPLECEEDVCA